MIGDRLLHYRILDKLGSGGMGEVYLAEDTRLKRRVAIKMLGSEWATDPRRRERFQREAEALASLEHPHIAVIHEVGQSDVGPFLCMQYVAGETLAERLERGRLELAEWLPIGTAIAEGLEHAHRHGVVHRDVKPSNVMLTSESRAVKIVDFGLAKLADPPFDQEAADSEMETASSAQLTRAGTALGTASYMSPEQARGERVDARSDLFSLGIVLYEMASGERPFRGSSHVEVLHATLSSKPTPLGELAAGLPAEGARIVHKALEKAPDRRYQTAADLAADLRNLEREVERGASGESGTARSAPGPSRRGRWIAALALLAVVILAALFWARGDREASPGAAEAASPAIAVVGFENLSDPEDGDQLGRMLMGLITTDLAETGGLPVVSVPRVLSALREIRGAAGRGFDPAIASNVAQLAGAEVMLVGQVGRVDGRLILTADVVDVSSGRSMGSQRREASSAADLFDLAGAMANGCRETLGIAPEPAPGSSFDLAKALTTSPEAYRHYVLGETALHRFEVREASEHFARAIAGDPSFALAYLRSGTAGFWNAELAAGPILQRGLPYADRLPGTWRTVYRAYVDYSERNSRAAWEALDPLTEAGVDVPDAYYIQGEIAVHDTRYLDSGRARRLFERALDIDPSFRIVWFHLIDEYIAAGDLAAARRALVRQSSADPEAPTFIEARAQLLAAEGRFEEAIELLEGLDEEESDIGTLRLVHLLLMSRSWDRALSVAEARLVDSTPSYTTLGMRALALLGQGHRREGLENVVEAARAERRNLSFASDLLRFGARVYEQAGELEDALEMARTAIEIDPEWPAARYTLGRLLLGAGRSRESQAVLGELRELSSELVTPIGRFWELLLEAELRLAAGQLRSAGDVLGRVEAMAQEHRNPVAEGSLRARWHVAMGDRRAAIAVYRQLIEPRTQLPWAEVIEPLIALHEIAVLEEAVGEDASALEHCRMFLDSWGEADLPMRTVTDARLRAERLAPRVESRIRDS